MGRSEEPYDLSDESKIKKESIFLFYLASISCA
jgi:hypothetical protein